MKEAKYVKSLTVALESEFYARIKEITDQRRISMAEFVREIFEKALSEIKEPVNSFSNLDEDIVCDGGGEKL